MKPQNRTEPSASWIACSSIDIWDDPFNNYHPAQTLGNSDTIYGGFCGISDGWVERLNRWIWWGNRVSPGALLARLATWALAMLGGKGGFGGFRWRREREMFPMISWWAAAMVFGLTKGLWMFVNVVTHMAINGPYSNVISCEVFEGRESPATRKKLAQLLRMRSASFPMEAWKPSS